MDRININKDELVIQSVMGCVHHPTLKPSDGIKLGNCGAARMLPSVGGVTYNVRIGDSVYAKKADHVEPGVSIKNPDGAENDALMALACIGNTATVASGDAKGAKGFVTGFHGGIDHTLVYFEDKVLDLLLPGDRILIRAHGQGCEIEGFPTVFCTGIDPELLGKLDIRIRDGKLVVPVAATVPAHLMGAGVGIGNAYIGDFDIISSDRIELQKYSLDKLRYGDIVLLEDCDHTYGRGFLTGAVTIGIIVHSDCIMMGHGPGVTTLLTCKTTLIEGKPDRSANLAKYMGIK